MPPVPAAVIDAKLRDADAMVSAGRFDHAAVALRDIVTLAPRHAGAHAALGWVLGQMNRPVPGVEMLRKAVSLDGTRALYHYRLGTLLQRSGESDEALASFQRAIALNPKMPDPYGAAASVFERSSRPAAAAAMIERGITAVPGDAQLLAIRCGMQHRAGHSEAARDGLLSLINSSPPPPPEALARAFHTLGLVLDALRDYPRAFEAHRRCNDLRLTFPREQSARARDELAPLIHMQCALPREFFERCAAEEPDDGLPTPAFLVGFPRSGTTMLENVLGAHPGVVATPERPMLHTATLELLRLAEASRQPLAQLLPSLDRATLARLRGMYWNGVQREIEGELGGRLLVDKFPLHVSRLGIINRLFPRARVLVAIRDPRDCVLSCFTQFFNPNPTMARMLTLEGAAEVYRAAMGLYLALKPSLTIATLEARYEETVADLPGRAEAMLSFLGLPWHENVLRPEDRARSTYVGTPSWQRVSGAVDTKRAGRWPNYSDQLEPVLPVLRPFIEAFGYTPSP